MNINNIIRCMKVVIIDDDKSSGKALADLLETKYGMEVLGCALCGLDGLAMVNKCQPDVLSSWMSSCPM